MRKSLLNKLLFTCSLIFMLTSFIAYSQISFGFNSSYKFLKGKDAASLASTWFSPGFDDSGWVTGSSPFHYGDGTGGTVLDDMLDNYSTVYMRSSFTAAKIADIEQITVTADFDDGFIVWINGNLVLQRNAPVSPKYNSLAPLARESGVMQDFIIPAGNARLVEGINYIAVQAFNFSLNSSDFYFGASIVADPELPRVNAKPVFSHSGGFYSTPFNLTISSLIASNSIAYTLDGSNPATSSTRILAGAAASVLIDPLSSEGRPLTPAVIVRACVIGTGLRPSFPEARTYIFLSEVAQQKYPGGGWPEDYPNQQIIDLPMDSKVVDDSRYSALIDFSLRDVPSISIITDINNLFDPVTGIYVNAMMDGEDWERECSVELINSDGSDGFQVNAGLRIRGGYSRHYWYPKHAFRLFFNSLYGTPKLNYPMFGDEGTSKFDKIDLRCEQNYSWANAGSGGPPNYNTGVREVFSRDTQRDLGQPYTRSRPYHLYLNGMYWGLFQSQERSEANFAASYLGGNDTDYDVVKMDTDGNVIEATDGNLDAWKSIYDLCNLGFTSNTNYFKLEGKDSNGKIITDAPVLVDIDNLIDYMMIIFYSGNFDSPTSAFGGNQNPNNFYAIYNRNLKNQGFAFFAHDGEHTLMYERVSPGTGLNEDRVNLAAFGGMNVSDFSKFHPQWLHEKLTANAEYRLRFADRATNYLRPGNVFSPEACLERFNSRASEIDYAIIAESARWGDSKGQLFPKTKDDTWIPELDKIRSIFFPQRSDILVAQLKIPGLLSTVLPSVMKADGAVITSASLSFQTSTTIAFQNPNTSGDIYYTLDGSDPRLVGGAVNPSAIKWTTGSNFELSNSSSIKSRINQGGVWSAINSANFLKTNEDYSKLKVTELMYHPEDQYSGIDTVFGTSLEFIEFKNTGTTSINISGMVLDSAVHSVFPLNTLLGPQQFYVVASKPSAFTTFYGFSASANFSGNFSNGGEYVLLTDPSGTPVISFTYNDKGMWTTYPDGMGYSLTSVERNPTGDPNLYSYWKSSNYFNGSPMADDTGVGIEEPLAEFASLNIYPNPTSEILTIELDAPDNSESFHVKIYTISGVLMYSEPIDLEKVINIKEYGIGPGIYLVRAESEKSLITRKLIVTR